MPSARQLERAVSDIPHLPEDPQDDAGAGHPEVPDLMAGSGAEAEPDAETTAATGSTAGTGSTSPSDRAGAKDSQRLMIAIAILVLVAVAAIGVGIARKSSTDSASTTPTSTPTTPTTPTTSTASTKPSTTAAGNGKSTTTKGGSTVTTAQGGTTDTTAKAGAGGCRNGSWPASYNAPPDAAVLKQPGVHVWNQNPGWKMRIVDADGNVYAGEVVANFALDPTAFKSVGTAKVEATGNRAPFEVTGSATAAGIDFQLPCSVDQFTISFTSKGAIVSPDRITIGKDAKAVSNPIIVNKIPA